MQRGNRLESVSKWLGHSTVRCVCLDSTRVCPENPAITYRHYWTDPVALQCTRPSEEPPSEEDAAEADTALYDALRAKIEECERLQSMLRDMSGPA